MSTDLYGARVLDVAPGEARARFRIFVVYYDVAYQDHAPLPDDDVGFFFRLLWEAAHDRPITRWHALQAVPLDDFLEPEWVDANAHRYVTRVERVASRNHPVGDDDWDGLQDFYYERDGGWTGEDRLVQADYDVHVTDPLWLDSLEAGYSWGTTNYVSEADHVTEADAPTVVDLREASRVLDPFPGGEREEATPSDLAFSDDGEFLAVTSQDCELVVYRTADWTEHARIPHDGRVPWGQDIQWVPETRLLTTRVLERSSEPPTTAYDVDAGTLVDVSPQPGESSSEQVVRPDGSHLAASGTAGSGAPSTIDLRRVDDGRLLMRCRPKGHHYVSRLAWSPDGRVLAASLVETRNGYGGTVHLFEPGAPLTVPEAGEPSEDELRARLDGTYTPEDILFLTGMLADREDDPDRRARVWRATAKRLADWATPPPATAEAYRRAIEHGTGPAAVADGVSLSRLLYKRGDLDGAVAAAREAHRRAGNLESEDRSRRLRFVAAVRLADMARTRGGDGDLDDAEAAYRVCLDVRPDDPWSLLGLGWVDVERGDAAAARPHLLRAVDAGDVKTEGYAAMLLGAPAKAARDLGEALRWYERAFTADGRHAPLAMGHLGELHYWLGERDGARRWYERMLEVTDLPELVAEACCRLGEMAAEDGDAARAAEHLERAAGTGDPAFAERAGELLDGLPRI
ncbi:hypothetical protein GCM10010182_68550 [Actinomadura cremea]|nr:hypothetical protein GCM10010182_68550 [Actinomadura cremea]